MKQITVILVFLIMSNITLLAQEKMYIYPKDKISLGALITKTDSVYFRDNGSTVYFKIGTTTFNYAASALDSISFGANSNTISVTYTGSSVSIINPLAFEGVTVTVKGADVTVNSSSSTSDINYNLTGTTTDGMFKIYSEKKFNLLLNGVTITNADGPAINIQSSKKATIITGNGTTNSLTDGSTYATSTEDQKATLFSEGQMVLDGTGSLTIKSVSKHAICSDDYISVINGTIVVSGAAKDGVHASDYFAMSGGTLQVTATSDGIDCEAGYVDISGGSITTINPAADVNGIASDSIMTISGGTINMTVSGNQSKGLNANQNMFLKGGNITINTSGAAVLETSGSGFDPSYCTAVKSDSTVTVSGATLTITSTGMGGKGISANKTAISGGNVTITTSGGGASYKNSGGTTDSYNATGITVDKALSITGGTTTISCSGAGSKGISSDGTLAIGETASSPVLNITTTGSKFIVSGSGQSADYAESKAIKCDGAVTINSGTTTISSADDGIKSETGITINKGTVTISKSGEGMEAPAITVNDGEVNITATDDGFNATKGNGGETNDGSNLTINGGNVVVSASGGDGLDSNGNITITGGTIIVHGPQSSPEVGMDYNGTCNVTGGFLIISGTNSNMTQAPGTSSSQYSIKATSTSSQSAIFHLQDASGTDLVTFKPVRSYYSMVFSSSALKSGATYYIYTGGSSTGTNNNGLYTGGTYSGGTQKKSFTLSSKVTTVTF